jgi:NTE family protein
MSVAGEAPEVGFVFGGGGRWGAVEVGMVEALLSHGLRPDLVLGTSIGAMNGAVIAANPTVEGAADLHELWASALGSNLLSASVVSRVRNLMKHRVALHDTSELRDLVAGHLTHLTFEELEVSFQCVAAEIETASEHWFDTGPLLDAILASSAIPGLFPPVEIDGKNYYDGGLVNSVPVDRAVALGCSTIYVLQVGRVELPLRRPTRIHEPALVAFEISRRSRFTTSMASLPDGIDVHVLPSGNRIEFDDPRQLRWRDLADTDELIAAARTATARYLADPDGAG